MYNYTRKLYTYICIYLHTYEYVCAVVVFIYVNVYVFVYLVTCINIIYIFAKEKEATEHTNTEVLKTNKLWISMGLVSNCSNFEFYNLF